MRHAFRTALLSVLLLALPLAPAVRGAEPRTAHYIASTHWDREWYESFQNYRYRLVSLLDEVLATLERDPGFRCFTVDGQAIPLFDYLEIRPERRELVERYCREGRLAPGPWYVVPDQWLVSGESLVRNLQLGMELSRELGFQGQFPGFCNDQFGHVGQIPQLLDQCGIPLAYAWRGLEPRAGTGIFLWRAPDGTTIPTYRFAEHGYTTFHQMVRNTPLIEPFDPAKAVPRLTEYMRAEGARTPGLPILLYDGRDHTEIEPRIGELFRLAESELAAQGVRVVHSDPAGYQQELLAALDRTKLQTFSGEMRVSRRDSSDGHLIPGVYSSRIHLKQMNAACEDELLGWAEPFCAFAAQALGREYPRGYFRAAWRHLIENHPHDSMCGCSIDQVHQDMLYRFDQSRQIAARQSREALTALALAAAPELEHGAMLLAVFNPTPEPLAEPVDLDIPLPDDWPSRFQEFFGYEEKFAFRLTGPDGKELPWQLVSQERDVEGFWRTWGHTPEGDTRQVVRVTVPLAIPALGYTTLLVEPADRPTRHSGSLMTAHNVIENEFLKVEAQPDGTIALTDKRTGKRFDNLLTFEDRADIGDGWFHGPAVNDRVHLSTAGGADLSVVTDGFAKATLRLALTMNLPAEFDFRRMVRAEREAPLRIVSELTLRHGSDRLEVTTTVENNVKDHRLRVLFPTGLAGDRYFSSSAFDVAERKVALPEDTDLRDELPVETSAQESWTAFGDSAAGLAVVARGLPECTVIDSPERPVALTLLRSFRRAVLAGIDRNPGGQIQGTHTFHYELAPFAGKVPARRLFLAARQVSGAVRTADVLARDLAWREGGPVLPREQSFLALEGNAVVTSIQYEGNALTVRLFNPGATTERIALRTLQAPAAVRCVTLAGEPDSRTAAAVEGGLVRLTLPAKRIATVVIE